MKLILCLLQKLGGLFIVLLQSGILEHKLIDVLLHTFILSKSKVPIGVSLQDFHLSLELVVFLIKEVNLVR
jgi:hypothetical protein